MEIVVPIQEIRETAKIVASRGYKQVVITIQIDGALKGSWFVGRSDFVLHPGLIVLENLGGQTEEAVALAIASVIRNQAGYSVDWKEDEHGNASV